MSRALEARLPWTARADDHDALRRQRFAAWVALAAAIGLVAGLATGAAGLSPSAFWADLQGPDAALILGQIRAPRTLGAALVGALLGLFTHAVEARAEVPGTRFTTRERMLLKLLPTQFLGHDGEPDADPYVRLLQVADFVAGMTDSYAVDMYRKLKGFALPT